VARFQNKIVIFPGPERPRHRRTDGALRGATFNLRLKVGTSPPEIVVHINRGNVMPLQALLESRDPYRCRDRVAKQFGRLGKGKIVDHVNEQEDDGRMLIHSWLWSRTLFVHEEIGVKEFGHALLPARQPLPRRSGHANRRSPFSFH
jgi:hypothetical protein